MTLCVARGCICATTYKRTRSVEGCITTQSVGTINV